MPFTIEQSLLDQKDEDAKQAVVRQAAADTMAPIKAISRHIPRAEKLRENLLTLFQETMEDRGREALERLIDEKPEVYFALAVRLLPAQTQSTVDVRHSLVETVRRSRELRGAGISVEPGPAAVVEGCIPSPDQG